MMDRKRTQYNGSHESRFKRCRIRMCVTYIIFFFFEAKNRCKKKFEFFF